MATYGGFATNTAVGSTTCTVNKPTGTATGDLLIAMVGKITTGSPTAPSGWSTVTTGSWKQSSQATLLSNGNGVYYKYITDGGSEPANYTWTSTSTSWSITIVRLEGYAPPILTAAGAIIGNVAFDWGWGFSRSGSVMLISDEMYWADVAYDHYWMIAAPTILDTGLTRTLSNAPAHLTEISNNSLVGISQLVAYGEMDMSLGYEIAGTQFDNDSSTGTARGYAVMVADPTDMTMQADARPYQRRPSISRVVNQ